MTGLGTLRSRLTIVTAVALAAALTLTACGGKKVRSAEDWLADQPFVLGVEILDSTVDT